MSQYRVTQDKITYAYGYDDPMSEYFLIKFSNDGEDESLVGTLSPIYGSGVNLFNKIQELNLPVKDSHKQAMLMDLPF